MHALKPPIIITIYIGASLGTPLSTKPEVLSTLSRILHIVSFFYCSKAVVYCIEEQNDSRLSFFDFQKKKLCGRNMKGPLPLLFVLWFPHTTVVQSFLLHKKGGCTTSSKPCGLIAPFLSSDLSIQPIEENVLMWNPRTTMGSAITTNYQQAKYAKIMAESSPSALTFLHSNVQAWLSLSMPLSSSSLPSTTILVASESTEMQQPPTKEEIKLLRQAFAVFYGVDRDLTQAEQLLSEAIQVWQRQPPDELAGLYRVRGDCYMVG